MRQKRQPKKYTHSISARSRKTGTRLERRYYLIVCEGKRSEPLYFEGLEKKLPRGQVKLELVRTGKCTTAVVDCAVQKRKTAPLEYDEVWAVFDRDDFPAEKFNEAIQQCKREEIFSAYSNEYFELWYVLHFQYSESAQHRSQYIQILDRELGGKYEKTDKKIYDKLQEHGDEIEAIRRAKRLFGRYNHHSPATENPSTTVFQLVEKLNRYKA